MTTREPDFARFNVREVHRILSATSGSTAIPAVGDRARWSNIRARLPRDEIEGLVGRAERYLETPVPPLPATLYLEFSRQGSREGYEEPLRLRRSMLSDLALAECLEGQGRFLDGLLNVVWAICEESSWAMPAHQQELADPERPLIDLGAAMTALALAEFCVLLGDIVDPAVSTRIRYEIDRRCLTPYLSSHDYRWMRNSGGYAVNNWAPVCTAGVVGAALHLEQDLSRLAELVARGMSTLADYIDGFGADGGSSEGPGYWSYGFGYYTIIADLLAARSDGEIDLLAGPKLRRIAEFPLGTQLSVGQYVPFSDCRARVTLIRPHLHHLAERLAIPALDSLAHAQPEARRAEPSWALRDLLWRSTSPGADQSPRPYDWYPDLSWLISRVDPTDPDALVVAMKGGHNGEMHNQNDLGSLVVHVGRESLVADLGSGRYRKGYFGPDRYRLLVNSSLGHSVPAPNGCAQEAGPQYAATVLEQSHCDDRDLLKLDLSKAYPPESEVEKLTRRLIMDRARPGAVELVDSVSFAGGPGTLQTVLISVADVSLADGRVIITGTEAALAVSFDPRAVRVTVDVHPDVELAEGPQTVRRIVFSQAVPSVDADLHLRIEPSNAP